MRWLPTISAFLLAISGGIYFGLFSCGGHEWHKQVFLAVLAVCTIAALVVPLSRSRPYLARLGLILGVGAGFIVSQSVATPFYPAAPESWPAFFRAFALALQNGPC